MLAISAAIAAGMFLYLYVVSWMVFLTINGIPITFKTMLGVF